MKWNVSAVHKVVAKPSCLLHPQANEEDGNKWMRVGQHGPGDNHGEDGANQCKLPKVLSLPPAITLQLLAQLTECLRREGGWWWRGEEEQRKSKKVEANGEKAKGEKAKG